MYTTLSRSIEYIESGIWDKSVFNSGKIRSLRVISTGRCKMVTAVYKEKDSGHQNGKKVKNICLFHKNSRILLILK